MLPINCGLIVIWLRCRRHLVLGTDIAPVGNQRSIGIDGDENAGDRHFSRLIVHGTAVQRLQGGLDLAKPLIDLVGQFVSVLVLFGEAIEFGLQSCARCRSPRS